ncbi:MAG: hypothetical protein JST66_13365 [Bacteroidetes bacterium]|nr:hypothetical protein [Bacteroidota bacterium]
MFRSLLLCAGLCAGPLLHAQPDSLYITENGAVTAYAVTYAPLQNVERYARYGHYAFDTTRVAVRLDYKRGKPCGIYRAYYPDGRPLIFAVYGWGWLHGDWAEYDPFGSITVKGKYREGKRDGTWAFRSEGIVGHYKDGKKHGKWKYYENGRVSRVEKYRNDKLQTGSRFFFGR